MRVNFFQGSETGFLEWYALDLEICGWLANRFACFVVASCLLGMSVLSRVLCFWIIICSLLYLSPCSFRSNFDVSGGGCSLVLTLSGAPDSTLLMEVRMSLLFFSLLSCLWFGVTRYVWVRFVASFIPHLQYTTKYKIHHYLKNTSQLTNVDIVCKL